MLIRIISNFNLKQQKIKDPIQRLISIIIIVIKIAKIKCNNFWNAK